MAIFFAICGLLCSAVNDFVFRKFAMDPKRSRGLYVFGIGIIWCVIACFMTKIPHSPDALQMTLIWGVISGIFSVVGNLLLIESMTSQSAGICSTIYRLNLVIVVPAAAICFHEKLTIPQIFGIALALSAIGGFIPPKTSLKAGGSGFLLAVLASICRAGMGISYKYAFLNGATSDGIVVINSLLWIFGGLVYAWSRERKSLILGKTGIKCTCISGLFVAGIVVFMALSVKLGAASVVLPIAQMSFLLTFLLGVIFLHEKITLRKAIFALVGAVAIILLTV